MAPKRTSTNNKNGDQNSGSANNGVPAPYMEPPPEYVAMMSRLSLLISKEKTRLDKLRADSEKHLKRFSNTPKKEEEMDIKMEVMDGGEGCSRSNATPHAIKECGLCRKLHMTKAWLPCRHFPVCAICNKKSLSCPICGTTKVSTSSR